jgi:hypothetical protein
MVFQPAHGLHGTLGGLLVALDPRLGFAPGLGLVVNARLAKDFPTSRRDL